jgi:hypothetical protein
MRRQNCNEIKDLRASRVSIAPRCSSTLVDFFLQTTPRPKSQTRILVCTPGAGVRSFITHTPQSVLPLCESYHSQPNTAWSYVMICDRCRSGVKSVIVFRTNDALVESGIEPAYWTDRSGYMRVFCGPNCALEEFEEERRIAERDVGRDVESDVETKRIGE